MTENEVSSCYAKKSERMVWLNYLWVVKESELPNEQMDWRLKHNLCVFIWRTEGAIPLGSWNEATVREWDLTQRYIVCGRMNWVNETNNQRLGSLVSCEWASLVSDWVSKRRSESDWLNAVYEKWINSKKLCLVRNGKRVLERAKEWSAQRRVTDWSYMQIAEGRSDNSLQENEQTKVAIVLVRLCIIVCEWALVFFNKI